MWVHSHQGRVFSDQLGIFHCLPSFVHGARLLYCFHFKLLKLSPSNKIWLRQYLCLERLGRKVRCLHIIPDQRTANIHLDRYQANRPEVKVFLLHLVSSDPCEYSWGSMQKFSAELIYMPPSCQERQPQQHLHLKLQDSVP